MSRRKKEVAALTDADCDRIEALTREIRALERAARALIGGLPRCRMPSCQLLAMYTPDIEPTLCDEHAAQYIAVADGIWREHPRTAPLRELL